MKTDTKFKLSTLIRWGGTGTLLYGVYTETGIYTATTLLFITGAIETLIFSIRRFAKKELESMNTILTNLHNIS